MENPKSQILNPKRGFTLFVAIVIMGTLLLVATGITSLAYKESLISSSGRESQYAFYAADSGAECALYWDVKNPTGFSAFSTSTSSQINCNQNAANPTNPVPNTVGSTGQSVFTLKFLPEPYCAVVTVTKLDDGTTKIESLGYNTCDTTNTRRVQRAVRASY